MTFGGSTAGKGPSVAELQRFIRDKRTIEVILLTGQKLKGVLKWFDEQAYCITMDDGESITLQKSAVIGYRSMGGKAPSAPAAAPAPAAAAPAPAPAAAAPAPAAAAPAPAPAEKPADAAPPAP